MDDAMITFDTAIRALIAAGIPLRNATTSNGDAYDYQDHPDVPKSRPVKSGDGPAWTEGNYDVDDWSPVLHPEITTRVWVECDTGFWLANDENGESADYSDERAILKADGWAYRGSGVIRIEVDPATVPAGDDWRAAYAADEYPTPKAVRVRRERERAYRRIEAVIDQMRRLADAHARVAAGTATTPDSLLIRQDNASRAFSHRLERHLMIGAAPSEPLVLDVAHGPQPVPNPGGNRSQRRKGGGR